MERGTCRDCLACYKYINSLIGPRLIGISEDDYVNWAYQQLVGPFSGVIISIAIIAALSSEDKRSMNARIAEFARVAVNSLIPQPSGTSQQDYMYLQ